MNSVVRTSIHKITCTGLLFFIIFFHLLIHPVIAQDHSIDRKEIAEFAFTRTSDYYDQSIGANSFLYTGRIYYQDYPGIRGHQFFMDNRWMIGNVTVKNMVFDSIYIMYDIYNNMLLAQHFDSRGLLSPVILNKNVIDKFEIEGHSFVRLVKDPGESGTGDFYEELFTGKHIRLYVRRNKKIMKAIEIGMPAGDFTSIDNYYLKKDSLYYNVGTRKLALQAMKDHKKEIKSFMKSKAIVYRNELEKNLYGLALYYDSLF